METVDPYRTPQADLTPGSERHRGPIPGKRSTRFGAALIDGALNSLLVFVPVFALVMKDTKNIRALDTGGLPGPALWASIAGTVVYTVIQASMIAKYNASLGKRMLGLVVLRADGGAPTLTQLLLLRPVFQILGMVAALVDAWLPIRTLAWNAGVFGTAMGILGLVDVLRIFAADRRCLHDLIAGTTVFDAKSIDGAALGRDSHARSSPRRRIGERRRLG